MDENQELAHNNLIDNNGIGILLYTKYFIKITKFMIIIFHISFIVGMSWLIICKIDEDFIKDIDYRTLLQDKVNFFDFISTLCQNDYDSIKNTFLYRYHLWQHEIWEEMLIATYFAFTTLSTVGFGDYCPQSDAERAIGSCVLLFGVLIFSSILNDFVGLIDEFEVYDDPINHGYELTKFFGLIKYFNKNKSLNESLKSRIEDHFNYRWEHNLNQAFENEIEQEIYSQMPIEV